MGPEDDVSRLPQAHATAVRMERAGMGDDAIAVALGIDVEAVRPLMLVAHAKLHRVHAGIPGAEPDLR